MDKSKKRNRIKIILISIIFLQTSIFCLVIYNLGVPKKSYSNREKAVIFLDEKIGLNQKLTKDNEIVLEDSREYLVDYNVENQTILYLNSAREIVERDRRTGAEEVMTHKELGISSQEAIRLHNLQYTQEGLSFIVGESLYSWERESNKLSKVLDSCVRSNVFNTYKWCGMDKVFFLSNSNDTFDLKVWDKEKNVRELEKYAGKSFVLNDEQNKIYKIDHDVKAHDFGIEFKYKIEEFNIEDGTSKKLLKFDSDNYILAIVDDRYLYYIQEHSHKKISKIYCYDLETQKKKCVHKTDKEVIGIFE